MTKFKHDEFAKDLLRTILELYGKVQIDLPITNELRRIDVFFTPAGVMPEDPTIQLLWRCATYGASFEPFRSPVRDSEVRSTISKLLDVHSKLTRKAKREKRPEPKTEELPQLWIITPTMSEQKLELANVIKKEGWCEGIYFMSGMIRANIIVVHELPIIPETVWFRTLGRGKVQQKAIDEIAALPKDSVYRQKVLELFASLKVNLEASTDRDPDDMELLMSLAESPVFVEYMERANADAIRLNNQSAAEILMVDRFGILDRELLKIVPNIIKLSQSEFMPLLLHLSREELIDRFTNTTTET